MNFIKIEITAFLTFQFVLSLICATEHTRVIALRHQAKLYDANVKR